MATGFYAPSNVTWFLGFGFGGNSGYLLPAWSHSYQYFPQTGFSSGTSIADTGSGFGPLAAISWNGVSGAAAYSNGLAFSYALSGNFPSNYLISGLPLTSGAPNCLTIAAAFAASAYVLDSLGNLSGINTTGGISGLTGINIPINLPVRATDAFTATSNETLYLAAGSGGLISLSLSNLSASIYSPPSGFQTVLCCCASGASVTSAYVGVAANALFAPSAVAAAGSPSSPSLLATIAPGYLSGALQIWSGATGISGPTVSYLQQATGLGLTSSVAIGWQSATGMLILDSGSGILYPYSYLANTLSGLTSLTGVSGTYPSIANYIGVSALVPQRSTSGIQVFALEGTSWTSVGSGSISGVTGVNIGPLAISNNILAAAYSGGISFASATPSNTWNFITGFTTPYTINTISVDQNGNFFAASSAASYLYSANPPSLLVSASTNLSGNPIGVASYNLQYFILTPEGVVTQDLYGTSGIKNNLFNMGQLGWVINTGTSANILSPITGHITPSGLLFYNSMLLAPSNSGIIEYLLGAPFMPYYAPAGAFAYYNVAGSTWSALSAIPQAAIPHAASFDSSGYIRFSCTDGSEFTVISGLTALSGQSLWSQGGGLVGMASSLVSSLPYMYGGAALVPAVIHWN